ncbi:hypothetical protein BUE93_20705 [Chromobacterium amazonense]|uniref:Uncharacterized protein n=1 Tax=Chromobacterium amazonense TaxID=1382803 RepID=A0A2S9WYZ7_9NEIS|nr:hypothetical protein [Chromobacterium amazonense]PRP68689.1 hypothetical protein BUE93_20705 [Chromobacterium amazonense]
MTGDQNDMLQRLKSLLPPTWFGDNTTIRDALLTAFSTALAWAYSLYLFAQAQTRIRTASGGWLDLIALDYFGNNLQRYPGQSDSSFLNRIQINLFRERTTRYGMAKVLHDLTGRWPTIIEPARPADVGGLGINIGLGCAGAVGSISMPNQALVTAYRPIGTGAGNWPGVATGAAGTGLAMGLLPSAQLQPAVTDADIVAAIEATKPYGTVIWMRISS